MFHVEQKNVKSEVINIVPRGTLIIKSVKFK